MLLLCLYNRGVEVRDCKTNEVNLQVCQDLCDNKTLNKSFIRLPLTLMNKLYVA